MQHLGISKASEKLDAPKGAPALSFSFIYTKLLHLCSHVYCNIWVKTTSFKAVFILIFIMAAGGCATFRAPKEPVREQKPTSAPKPLPSSSFTLDRVTEKAMEMAGKPYEDSQDHPPDFLDKITYDQWRDIRFKPDRALWKDENLPFQVHFFLGGFVYNRRVHVNVVEGDSVKEISVNPDDFDFGSNTFDHQAVTSFGFAGFRLHYPLNKPDYHDELVVFLGASYFRALGQGHRYGLSARGLAIDTAEAGGEEFPFFKEFWISKPGPQDNQIEIFALMDSQSLTGAYHFVIYPGKDTAMDVDAKLFFRKQVKKLGVAPLTSMFLYGENEPGKMREKDFRPEVHDSDGLYIRLANEDRTWRPLINPEKLFVNSFSSDNLQEFGLLQRDVKFENYQDLEARYELRPSVFVEPKRIPGDGSFWDQGRIELVQIPTDREINDNIVAYWVSSRPFEPGQSAVFSYRMRWAHPEKESPVAWVDSVRVWRPEEHRCHFVVDFAGGEIASLGPGAPLEPDVKLMGEGAQIVEKVLFKNEATGGWRLVLTVEREKREGFQKVLPEGEMVLELRATILKEGRPVSEAFSYAVRF